MFVEIRNAASAWFPWVPFLLRCGMTRTTPDPGLFRQEALEHFLEAEEGRTLVRVSPPWTWALLLVLLAGLTAALVLSVMGKVEVNGRGRGILHPETGIPVLLCQVEGTVGQVEVHSGQTVAAGDVLVRIDAPAVQARLLEARRATQSVREQYAAANLRQDRAFARQCRNLQLRAAKLEEQGASLEASVARFHRRLQASQILEREGVSSTAQADEAREAYAQALRSLGASQQALEQVRQERAALDHQRQDALWSRDQTIRNAETQEQALAYIHAQTLVKAPRGGVIEALLVRPGEVVVPGKALGKLVPQEQPLRAVCFLAEKDRAFVKEGDAALLELDQLPYAEYGTLRARVLRVSSDLASPHELQEALGEGHSIPGPTFRVELELTEVQAAARAKVPLRSGMLLNARFTLRRQRLITLVLEPLRKWLE